MSLSEQIAKQLKAVHFGGNWTAVNLKETLAGIDWKMATTKVHSFNTIASLVFHMHYYVNAILKVFRREPLDAHDKFSFQLPPIQSQEDWEELLRIAQEDAEALASLIEQFPESKLEDKFVDGKYGNYFRNLTGLIEHTHYHLGQIVLLKKLLMENPRSSR